jgi:iron complex outermembrane recepter protein
VVGNHSFRLNLFGGPEETHLAYLGIPAEYLNGEVTGDVDRDRRFNPLSYPGERDHFFEPHYELIHSWAFSPRAALSQTLFWFDGRGYYDEQRFGRNLSDYRLAPWATSDSTLFDHSYYRDTDGDGVLDRDSLGRAIVERFDPVRRREVVNRHFGWIPRLRLVHPGGALTVGGELRGHDGHHTGQLLSGNGLPPGTPADLLYYDYHPRTLSGGLFLREEWNLRPELLATADLAWRHQSYSMRDDRFDGIRFQQPYDFALPRLGLTWTPRADLRLFGSWAYARREPSFQDLYAAEAVGSLPLYRRVDPATNEFSDPLIRPEQVNDLELGGSWTRERLSATLNLFRMGFRDELIPFQYNADVNNWVPTNAARSIHQGAEASGLATLPLPTGAIASLAANGTWSDNHFVEFEDALDAGFSVSRDGNRIPYFPEWTANLSARVAWRHSSFALEGQQVGRIYLDNAEDRANSIGPHAVWNAVAGVSHPVGSANAALSVRVLNLLDRRYATSGYMDYDAVGNLVPMFVPAATRGVLGELRVEW